MMICKLCHKPFWVVTNTHLSSQHGTSISDYNQRFGTALNGIAVQVGTLPKSDPRYRKWRESLKHRPPPWSKGYTKETHPSVAKISKTFKRRGIDNFARWRVWAREHGIFPKPHLLQRRNHLAFLIGLILGDGNISKFPRTECLRIALGTDKPALWKYVAKVVKKVFRKEPAVFKRSESACMTITIYQKDLGQRLNIPLGARGQLPIKVPRWIWGNRQFLVSCLKGLFEAEGSFSIHEKTCTYNLSFSNRNQSLLDEVARALRSLGFHPEERPYAVRLRKRAEAFEFDRLINFRKYD